MTTADVFQPIATEHIHRGLAVTPLKPGGKQAFLPGWPNNAVRSLAQVEALLAQGVSAACNVGIVMGSPSGIVSIDIDDPVAFTEAGLVMPPTAMFHTTRPNGYQALFAYDGQQYQDGPGYNFLGDGKQACGPGSIVGGKQREWILKPEEMGFAPLPSWVMQRATSTGRLAGSSNVGLTCFKDILAGPPIKRGARNNALYEIAQYLRFTRGASLAEILQLLVEVNSSDRMPFPISEREVESIARSAARYESRRAALREFEAAVSDTPATALGRWEHKAVLLAQIRRAIRVADFSLGHSIRCISEATGITNRSTIKQANNRLHDSGMVTLVTPGTHAGRAARWAIATDLLDRLAAGRATYGAVAAVSEHGLAPNTDCYSVTAPTGTGLHIEEALHAVFGTTHQAHLRIWNALTSKPQSLAQLTASVPSVKRVYSQQLKWLEAKGLAEKMGGGWVRGGDGGTLRRLSKSMAESSTARLRLRHQEERALDAAKRGGAR